METSQRLTREALSETLRTLSSEHYWGILRVRDSGAWKEYDFASGGIKVTSLGDRRAPMLGQILSGKYYVPRKRIEELVEKQPETRQLIGEMCVSAQLCSEQDLLKAVRHQIVQEVADLHVWSGGRFFFQPGQRRPKNSEFDAQRDAEGVTPVSWSGSLGALLQDAQKAFYEFENLRKQVGSGETVYTFTASARDKLYKQGGFQTLVDSDQRVAVLLDGKRSLSEIIAKVPYGLVETLRIVHKLKKAGALKQVR